MAKERAQYTPTTQERRMPPVRVSTFTSGDGNGLGKLAPHLEALSPVTGPTFVEAVRQGRVTDRWRKRLDREMYRGIRREYGLEEASDREVGRFYKKALAVANTARVDAQHTLFPNSRDVLNLMNEVGNVSTAPHLLVEYAASDVTPRLREELQVQAATALVAAEVVRKTEYSKAEDYRAELQWVLGKRLFKKPLGYTEREETYTQHSDATNQVVWVEEVDQPDLQQQDGIHWRLAVQDMRPVEDLGMVETNIHTKKLEHATQKAIRKAQKRQEKDMTDDAVDPHRTNEEGCEDVEDYVGMMFVVKAPNNHEQQKVVQLRDRVVDIVQDHFGDERLDRIVIKDKNGAQHTGQSEKARYKRVMVYFKGEPVPVELMFESERYYRDTQEDVGVYDEEKGKYTGLAHEIYVHQRLMAIQPLLIPGAGDSHRAESQAKLHEKAERIKREGRITPPEGMIYQRPTK